MSDYAKHIDEKLKQQEQDKKYATEKFVKRSRQIDEYGPQFWQMLIDSVKKECNEIKTVKLSVEQPNSTKIEIHNNAALRHLTVTFSQNRGVIEWNCDAGGCDTWKINIADDGTTPMLGNGNVEFIAINAIPKIMQKILDTITNT